MKVETMKQVWERDGRLALTLVVCFATAACSGGSQAKTVQIVAGDQFVAKVVAAANGSLSAQFVAVDSSTHGVSLDLRGLSLTNQMATGHCTLHASLATIYVDAQYQPSNLTLDCGHGVLTPPLALEAADGNPGLPPERPGDFVMLRATDQAVIDVSLYTGTQ